MWLFALFLFVLPVKLCAHIDGASGANAAASVGCRLTWRSCGYGQVPIDAVPVHVHVEYGEDGEFNSSASNLSVVEYIGRVRIPATREWALGRLVKRLSPTENTISGGGGYQLEVIHALGSKSKHSTYQVLLNPTTDSHGGCQLNWTPSQRLLQEEPELEETLVRHFVSRGSEGANNPTPQAGPFIGRVHFAGLWLTALVNAASNRVTFIYNGDLYTKSGLELPYEILQSTYDGLRLRLDLNHFLYDENSFATQSNSSEVVLGKSGVILEAALLSSRPALNQRLVHERSLREEFRLELATTRWNRCPLAELKVNINLWYAGGDPIQHIFTVVGQDGSLQNLGEIERVRNMSVEATLTWESLGAGGRGGGREQEIVSTATVFDGTVPFQAQGKLYYYHSDMATKRAGAGGSWSSTNATATLKKLATRCGWRLVGGKVGNNEEGGWVSVVVQGTVSGSFIIGTQTHVVDVDQEKRAGSCVVNPHS